MYKHKKELNIFLNGLSDKYIPDHLAFTFTTTTHFINRLLVDRSDNLDKLWVSKVFSRIFHDRLCEFLYLLEITPEKGRINLQFEGKSIALVYDYRLTEGDVVILTTCFTGVALNPTLEYSILSLDQEA